MENNFKKYETVYKNNQKDLRDFSYVYKETNNFHKEYKQDILPTIKKAQLILNSDNQKVNKKVIKFVLKMVNKSMGDYISGYNDLLGIKEIGIKGKSHKDSQIYLCKYCIGYTLDDLRHDVENLKRQMVNK